jgi:hypothetical protein
MENYRLLFADSFRNHILSKPKNLKNKFSQVYHKRQEKNYTDTLMVICPGSANMDFIKFENTGCLKAFSSKGHQDGLYIGMPFNNRLGEETALCVLVSESFFCTLAFMVLKPERFQQFLQKGQDFSR